MMVSFHTTLLLSVAWALFIFDETKVHCGIVVVQSSSSSEFETYCNGLHCPPGSNCLAYTGFINGNNTSDKRCSNNLGDVVRQETVTVFKGEMCIKNLTMIGGTVNVEHSCRNLSKAERDYMTQNENNSKILQAVQDAMEQKQDAVQDVIERARQYEQEMLEKADRINTHKSELLDRILEEGEMQADALEQEVENRAEFLEKYQEAKMDEME